MKDNPLHKYLPEGTSMRRIDATYLGERFDWFRVEDDNDGIIGSGFDREEAIRTAWEELQRRSERSQ